MQFKLVAFTALLSMTSAAAVNRFPISAKLVSRQNAGLCGGLTTPLCCQTDVLGVANLNCAAPGDVATTEDFTAACAESGSTAQCCVLPVLGDGLICNAA